MKTSEKQKMINRLQIHLKNLTEARDGIRSLVEDIIHQDWLNIKWEFIDSKRSSQFYVGSVGRMKTPYLYIRQEIDGNPQEIILTKKQVEDLQVDLEEFLSEYMRRQGEKQL